MKKLKYRFPSIKPWLILVIFAAACLAAIPLRTYQSLERIDPVTGFYTVRGADIPILYGVVAVAAVLILLLSFLSGSMPAALAVKGRNPLLGILALGLSGGLVFEGYRAYTQLLSGDFGSYPQGADGIKAVMMPLRFEIVLAALAAVYFLFYAVSFFIGKPLFAKLRILALTPAAWEITRLVFRFTRSISYIKVSDLLGEMLGIGMFMIFFVVFARVSSRVAPAGASWSVVGVGLSAALITLCYSVPRAILAIGGNSDLLVKYSDFYPCDLLLALFALVYVIYFLRSGVPQSEEAALFPESVKKEKSDKQDEDDAGEEAGDGEQA